MSGRRAAIVALAVAVAVALGGGLVWWDRTGGGGPPSYSFCLALGDVPARLADVEAVTTRTHGQGADDLETYRGLLDVMWTPAVAADGPGETDADAAVVMGAIRRSVTADDPGPLHEQRVRSAARRLGPAAAAACKRVER